MEDYNYKNFTVTHYRFNVHEGSNISQMAKNFELEDVNSNKKSLLNFDGKFLVLELGSITCGLFNSRREKMLILKEKFPEVAFTVLYVREAHPGNRITSHHSFEHKKKCAALLKKEYKENRTILIDDINGNAHKAYGNKPNSIFIIDKSGIVRFKADWNDPTATQTALTNLLNGKDTKNVKSYFKPPRFGITIKTLLRSGKGAGRDFLRNFPTLIWKNLIKYNIATFFNRH